MNNLKALEDRLDLLNQQKEELLPYIQSDSTDKLVSRKHKNGKYYFSVLKRAQDGKKTEIYLPKTEIETCRKMAFHAYASARVRDIDREAWVTELMLRYAKREKEADLYLQRHPGPASLIWDEIWKDDPFVEEWVKAEYQRNPNYPEALKYPTIFPELKVRSKAESQIVDKLVQLEIPFRYEEMHIFNGVVLHPDFTLLNKRTHKIMFLEHQGMRDKPDYAAKVYAREETYRQAGIIPWKDLLITTETYDEPLDLNWLEVILRYYLL